MTKRRSEPVNLSGVGQFLAIAAGTAAALRGNTKQRDAVRTHERKTIVQYLYGVANDLRKHGRSEDLVGAARLASVADAISRGKHMERALRDTAPSVAYAEVLPATDPDAIAARKR